MSDQTALLQDATRQLRKAAETLGAAEKHLRSHAEANAALHMASEVIYSPLCNAVTLTKQDIEQWIAAQVETPVRYAVGMVTEPPQIAEPDQHPIAEHIAELDRKRHPEDYLQREWGPTDG